MTVANSANNQQNRLLIIGLDGGCPEIIEKLLAQGKLPNLEKISRRGNCGILKSTILPITPTAWTSFFTGKNPAKHGVFDFMERKKGSHDLQIVLTGQTKESLWEILTRAGKRLIVINVPMTYPPVKVNGIMISGLPALDARRDFAYPQQILDEVEREVGEYRIHYRVEFTGENYNKFLNELHFLIGRRSQVARYLARNYPWDLMMVHFQATDWVQHFFWKYSDPSHPDYNPFPTVARDAISNVYAHIDEEIGKILNTCPQDTNVIVMSDHGFGPLYKLVYINNYLNKIGILRFKRGPKYLFHRLGITSANFYKFLVKIGLGNMIPRFRQNKQGMINLFLSYNDIDWNRTKAYSIGHNGQIYINLKGREPQGYVAPGAEYEDLRTQVIKSLSALIDPSTGLSVFDSIYRKEELYSGTYIEKAPDIIGLLTRYNQEMNYSSNELIGDAPNNLSGYHRLDGFCLFSGAMFAKTIDRQEANIIDLAPTILYLFGIAFPKSMDGKILQGVLSEDFKKVAGSPVEVKKRSSDNDFSEKGKPEYSKKEKEIIQEKLRKLGYL